MTQAIRLDGQVAVVTGSGRGLGLAFAQALARAGAKVVVNDVDAATAAAAVEAIRDEGGEAVAEVVAVGPTAAADQLVRRAVDTWGRLDVMCANAGILRDRVLWNMTDDDFDAVIETHLRGTFTCARAAVRQMRAQGEGGSLVLLASPAGQQGNFGQGNYSAAKAGITGFTRTWAMECAKAKITVNAIVPVAFTQMVATIPALAQYAEQVARGEGLPAEVRRDGLGLPEDVAPLLVFLASQQARGITGQCIGIGGDKLALWSHPQETRVSLAEGGWSAEGIAGAWEAELGGDLRRAG